MMKKNEKEKKFFQVIKPLYLTTIAPRIQEEECVWGYFYKALLTQKVKHFWKLYWTIDYLKINK